MALHMEVTLNRVEGLYGSDLNRIEGFVSDKSGHRKRCVVEPSLARPRWPSVRADRRAAGKRLTGQTTRRAERAGPFRKPV